MTCRDEWLAMLDAEERYGSDDSRYLDALGAYLLCMMPIIEARHAHASAWDERMFQHWQFLREAWEAIFGKIDIPPRPEFDVRSAELRKEIFADIDKAMIFSKNIEQAFQESGIQLADDEAFACVMYVRKRPTSLSDVITGGPLVAILEPKIMQPVLEAIQKAMPSEPK